MMEQADEQIIIDYLNGNKDSFGVLVERHLKAIYNFVYRMMGDASEAEDVTQDVFLKVWKNLKKYHRGENFKTWLFAIARNTTIDYLRKKKYMVFSDFENAEGENFLTDTLADIEPLADEMFARMQDKEMLQEAFALLPPLYREVLLMRYSEDLTFDEIGKIVGKPLHTVKSQHRRGLEKLREYFNAPK